MKIIFEDVEYENETPMYNTQMFVDVEEHAKGKVIDLLIKRKNSEETGVGIVLDYEDAKKLVLIINMLLDEK